VSCSRKRGPVKHALLAVLINPQTLDLIAKMFAEFFRKSRDQVKREFDKEIQDILEERGEFEARMIEGKKPEPSGNRTQDILNEALDLIRSGMGSGPLPEWKEPDWREIAERWIDEEELEQRSRIDHPEFRLTKDDETMLKSMGIQTDDRSGPDFRPPDAPDATSDAGYVNGAVAHGHTPRVLV